MVVGETLNQPKMPSYPLRYHKDMVKFLNVLNQLLNIYETESPKFFRKCVQNVPIDIYDKIIELNGYKIKSKYWSQNYINCIILSKRIIAAISTTEKEEYKNYLTRLNHYETHYGGEPIHTGYVLTMTPPPEYSD